MQETVHFRFCDQSPFVENANSVQKKLCKSHNRINGVIALLFELIKTDAKRMDIHVLKESSGFSYFDTQALASFMGVSKLTHQLSATLIPTVTPFHKILAC